MTSKLVGMNGVEQPRYFDGNCNILLHKGDDFVFLANVEQMKISRSGSHCDAVFVILRESRTYDVFLIELKETSNTDIKTFVDDILTKDKLNIKGYKSVGEVEEFLKTNFSLKHHLFRTFVVVVSESIFMEIKNNRSYYDRVLYDHLPVNPSKGIDGVIIIPCGHALYNNDGNFIQLL